MMESKVFRLLRLDVDGVNWEGLVKSRMRSWRLDVWAEIMSSGTEELRWIGVIDSTQISSLDELDEAVRTLIKKDKKS